MVDVAITAANCNRIQARMAMISSELNFGYRLGYRFGYGRLVVCAVVWLLLDTSVAYGLDLERFFKRSDQRAVELLQNGQAEAAASEFTDPQWRGVSRYKAGLYQEAMEDFGLAEDANGLYNLGTAAARAGDYNQSVASLEQALELAPENTNIAHNLEIAKKLKDLAEQQQQQSDQDQDDQESESDENSDSDESDQQSDSQDSQEGDQGEQGDEQESSESNSDQQSDSENESQENSGEMSADEQDQNSESQEQDAEDLREMMQQEQQAEQEEQPEQQPEQQQMAASQPESVSEDDQATEQWLRRIPDDASQLLRNKIRLNHMIEYPQVDDMQEPW